MPALSISACERTPKSAPFDVTHALKIFDPDQRSRQRSELPTYFAEGIVEQCNPDTIVPAPPPDLAAELRLFDANYAKLYGTHALPSGHGNLQFLLPPSFRRVLPDHRREIYDAAVAFSGRPEPVWPPTSFCHSVPPSLAVTENTAASPQPISHPQQLNPLLAAGRLPAAAANQPPPPPPPVAAAPAAPVPVASAQATATAQPSLEERLSAAAKSFLPYLQPVASLPGCSGVPPPVISLRGNAQSVTQMTEGERLPRLTRA